MAPEGRPWHSRTMASNVVNLNRHRKKKAREEAAKRAETNRRLHGRTQAEKDRDRVEKERAARALECKRLVPTTSPVPTSTSPETESREARVVPLRAPTRAATEPDEGPET